MSIRSHKTLKTLKSSKTITGQNLTFSALLWSIRRGEEKTQVEFAEILGVSKQYLCDLENGRRCVSPKTAAEYANKLGYSVKQFVRLCLQDMLSRDGLNYDIELKAA